MARMLAICSAAPLVSIPLTLALSHPGEGKPGFLAGLGEDGGEGD